MEKGRSRIAHIARGPIGWNEVAAIMAKYGRKNVKNTGESRDCRDGEKKLK